VLPTTLLCEVRTFLGVQVQRGDPGDSSLSNGTADKLLVVTLYLSGKRYGACMATVNFYAAARAASGVSVSEFEGQTLAEVIAAVSRNFPKVGQILPGCSYLINGTATLNMDIKVNPSDVIDILPRFAGGS
jgi:molybdopterin converting factor small subunit